MKEEYGQRVLCSGCGKLLYDGPQELMPAGLLSPNKEPCPDCSELSRRVELELVAQAQLAPGVFLNVAGQTAHSDRHPFSRDIVHQTRRGHDGRLVHRIMDIAREHKPPFKWHRVIDAESEEVIKNELLDLNTKETYDFTSPNVEAPAWFPCGDPRST